MTQNLAARRQISARWRACRQAYSDASTLSLCVPSRKIECVRTRLPTTESERSGRRVELASEPHKKNNRGVGYVDDVGSVCSGDDWTKSEDEDDNALGSRIVAEFADGHCDDESTARLEENQPASDRGHDHRHGHVHDPCREKDMALAQWGLEDDGEVVVFYNSKLAKICEHRWQSNLLRARERCE
jgi:hypothetical protein